ncbi:MAG: hypothetical protein ACYCZF_01625 [Anaerolineae bacterium]
MPGKSTSLANKPRARKSSSGSKRLNSATRKPPDQRRIRIPVVGGGGQVGKPNRRPPRKMGLPGCLLSTTLMTLIVLACIIFAVSF